MTITLTHLLATAFAILAKLIPICFGISRATSARSYYSVAMISIVVFLAQVVCELVISLILFGGLGILVDPVSIFVLGSYMLNQIPVSQFQLLFGVASFLCTLGILSWCWRLSSKLKVVSL